MEKLSADAKDSVARMIEKHSQEMLLMIAKRMSESESQVSSHISYEPRHEKTRHAYAKPKSQLISAFVFAT